jgi:hypothetical protein
LGKVCTLWQKSPRTTSAPSALLDSGIEARADRPRGLATSRFGAAAVIAPLGVALWLGYITVRYFSMALAVGPAEFMGISRPLLLVLAPVGGAAGLAWVGRRANTGNRWLRMLAATAAAAPWALASVILVIAGLGAVVASAWTFVLASVIGDRILSWLLPRSRPVGEVLGIGVGLGVLSHGVLLLALVGALHPWVFVAIIAAVPLVAYRGVVERLNTLRERLVGLSRWARAPGTPFYRLVGLNLLGFWIVLLVIEAVAPEIQYDALNYHLSLPQLYLAQGRMVLTSYHVQGWFYGGTEMNYLLELGLAGQTAAKLLNLGVVLLTALAIWSLTTNLADADSGLWAAIAFAAIPLVGWEGTTASVDVALALYFFLLFAAAARAIATAELGWWVIAGLLGGFALSVKLNAAIDVAMVGVVCVGWTLWRRAPKMPFNWSAPVGFAAAALLAGIPWPLLRYLQTGNPVMPFFNALFGSPYWPPVNETFNFQSFGIGTSWPSLLRLPWEMTFSSQLFNEAVPAGVFGVLVLAVPCALFARLSIPEVWLGLTLVIGSFAAWAFSAQVLRYYLPTLPIVATLVFVGLRSERLARAPRRLLNGYVPLIVFAWLICGIPLYLGSLWNVPDRIPWRLALGLESRDEYLHQGLRTFGPLQYVNQALGGRGGRVLLLSNQEEDRLYCNCEVETMNSLELRPMFNPSTTDEQAASILQLQDFAFLLIDRQGISGGVDTWPIVKEPFLRRFGSIRFAESNVEVYALHWGAPPPEGELVVDPRFEPVHLSPNEEFSQTVSILPATTYQIGYELRSTGTTAGAVIVQVSWAKADGAPVGAYAGYVAADEAWSLRRQRATAPPYAERMSVLIRGYSGSIDLDSLSVQLAQHGG